MKKGTKKPNRTLIRIIKAYIFGIVSGILLLEYIRNKKRPYLPCDECVEKAEKLNNTETTDQKTDIQEEDAE